MKLLKSYVHNKNFLESCIAEEAIEFFSEYQKRLDAIGNSIVRYQKLNIKEDVDAFIKGEKKQSID